jgi:hypothetical protein
MELAYMICQQHTWMDSALMARSADILVVGDPTAIAVVCKYAPPCWVLVHVQSAHV